MGASRLVQMYLVTTSKEPEYILYCKVYWPVTVEQWFERARFEAHEGGVVMLGLVGAELVGLGEAGK